MSDIQRRIVTLFEARGAGQMRAMLGEMRSGMGGYRSELRNTQRELSIVDKQMRAMGTTARYALSGVAIFGGVGLVSQLNQVQQQLGLISAISPTAFSGVRLSGDLLREFGEEAEDAAFRANSGINEFNEGLINLVSTVQNVPRDQVVPILEQIAQTAKLSLTPVDEATKGITGLLVAFGESPTLKNAQRMLAEYQRLIFTVPGGAAAGPQIIQQLPQLAGVSRLANVNPEQLFGLLNTILRAGGNPSTSARGLQYLIQGLAQPPSPGARAALASAGITPQAIQDQGGIPALFRLIQEVKKRGVRGNVAGLRGMSEETLSALEGTEGADSLAGLGISGEGAEFARKAVGRIHGVRALILLAAQGDQISEDLRAMTELGKSHAAQVAELRDSWKAFEDEAQLQKAGLAVNQMALDIAQAFEPVFNFAGEGLIRMRNLFDDHSDAASYGLAGILGTAYLAKRRGLRLPGLGGLGAAHATYSAVTNLGVETQLGASPTNPMFVAVVYSLGGSGPLGSRGSKPPPVPVGGGHGSTKGGRSRFSLAPFGGFGPMALATLVANIQGEGGGLDPTDVNELGGTPRLMALLRKRMTNTTNFSKAQLTALKMLDGMRPGTHGWDESKASKIEQFLAGVGGGGAGQKQVKLKATGELTVHVNTPQGKQTHKVPLELFSDFTQPAPQTRGQNKTNRSGN